MTTAWVWRLKKYPLSSWDSPGSERYGQRCTVLARGRGRGPMNVLVRFEDGALMVGTRYCVQKVKGR